MNASGMPVVRMNPERFAGSTDLCLRSLSLGILIVLLINLLGLLLGSPLPAAG